MLLNDDGYPTSLYRSPKIVCAGLDEADYVVDRVIPVRSSEPIDPAIYVCAIGDNPGYLIRSHDGLLLISQQVAGRLPWAENRSMSPCFPYVRFDFAKQERGANDFRNKQSFMFSLCSSHLLRKMLPCDVMN
jgi:hypothetical protein